MSDFQTKSFPTARKVHTCCECQGDIQPCRKYQLISGSWEGSMDSFKTCMPCRSVRNWATTQPEWGGRDDHLYYFGMLEEHLANMAQEIAVGDGRRFRTY